MTKNDILLAYGNTTNFPTKLNSSEEDPCFEIGSFSIWPERGKWVIGVLVGNNEEADIVECGESDSFEDALISACHLEFKFRLQQAKENVEERMAYEASIVEEIDDA